MNEVVELLNEIILNNEITYGVLSNLRIKDEESFSKVIIKPCLLYTSSICILCKNN